MFSTQKARFEESWSGKPVCFSIKHNFLEKVAFWAKVENVQAIMELWRSILEKVHAHSQLSVGLFEQLPNYPSINHVNFLSSYACFSFLSSHLSVLPFALKLTHASHLFSLLCSLRAATNIAPSNSHRLSSLLSALLSSCCYKHSTIQLSPVYHHNPFQHLIIQTQNQQNQTKNNSKSTQKYKTT